MSVTANQCWWNLTVKKHLLNLDELTQSNIHSLLDKAKHYEQHGITPHTKKCLVASLFYENSTRTTASFEIAAKGLGFDVLNFSLDNSSLSKGESIADTTKAFIAMGVDAIIMRHKSERLIFDLKEAFGSDCSFINAGSGATAHPTQALLDLYTLRELGTPLENLNVALVGDLKHSRVVRSLIKLFGKMGLYNYRLVSPPEFSLEGANSSMVVSNLAEGLVGADVVIALRVQKERFIEGERLDLKAYQNSYCLRESIIEQCCPNAKIMHPGPMNRGVEIDSELADGPRSLIFKQVRNGVLVRAAILDSIVDGK